MKFYLTLVLGWCFIASINCGDRKCDTVGSGRIVSSRGHCNGTDDMPETSNCTIELVWVPGSSHEGLSVRLKVQQDDAWMVVRDGPIPDVTTFSTDMQYTSEIIIPRKELPTPPEVKVEVYQPAKESQPEVVEVCSVVDKFES